MHGAESFLTILGLIVAGFVFFVIYFIFKQLQFVLVSVNLYKKMVRRQDAMLTLLIDIRDNTKQFKKSSLVDDDDYEDPERESSKYTCNKCGSKVPVGEVCPKCKTSSSITESDDCICGKCGAEVSEKDKFCPNCGTEIGESGGYVCSECGGDVSLDDKKCPKCGKDMNE